MTSAVIIVAAGTSTRMGVGKKKEYLQLNGKPVLQHSYEAFYRNGRFQYIYFVVPPAGIEEARKVMISALSPEDTSVSIQFVEGGATRQESVYNGLRALESASPDYVLIHDGARPWISGEDIETVLDNSILHGACAPTVVPSDAIKKIGKDRFIREHHSRDDTLGIQTPQGFNFSEILHAHASAACDGVTYIDDTEIYCRYVHPVYTVPGSERNRKITYSHDIGS